MVNYKVSTDLELRLNKLIQVKIVEDRFKGYEEVKYNYQLNDYVKNFINQIYNCKTEANKIKQDISKLDNLPKVIKVASLDIAEAIGQNVSAVDFGNLDMDIDIISRAVIDSKSCVMPE